ncbi:IclR family transcriptional regulator [Oceanobacillus oncorhynchi subsp. oncorhynchi]|uniref:IclR family transcriptional regulator n=1 Tax=Oceanobacillus oncorhynchi TaxID=545501 RepID=UPI00363CB92D
MLKTLDKAIQVLNCFTKEKTSWGVRELARELNTSHTIISRILKTFENNGFLTQDKETKKYYLGLKFIEFSQIIQERISVTEEVLPIMETISELTKESIFLTWKENNEGVTLAIAESEERIKFSVSIGTRTPLYVGASCKSIMAYVTDDEKMKIIEEAELPDSDISELLEELNQINRQGWSYTCGEYSDQVFGLSVPLFDNKQQIIASITIAGPAYRINEEKKAVMLKVLQEETRRIQQMIYNLI